MLDVWMWKRPTLGDGRVESGGGKLLAVTHRNPGLHAEREIERWEDARRRGRLSLGFRGKKTCGSGELDAKKGGSHGLGRVQGTQVAGTGGAAGWKCPLGGVEGAGWGGGDTSAPARVSSFPVLRKRSRSRLQALGVKVLGPQSEGMGVETWREERSQLGLQLSCTTATRTYADQEPAGHSVT